MRGLVLRAHLVVSYRLCCSTREGVGVHAPTIGEKVRKGKRTSVRVSLFPPPPAHISIASSFSYLVRSPVCIIFRQDLLWFGSKEVANESHCLKHIRRLLVLSNIFNYLCGHFEFFPEMLNKYYSISHLVFSIPVYQALISIVVISILNLRSLKL